MFRQMAGMAMLLCLGFATWPSAEASIAAEGAVASSSYWSLRQAHDDSVRLSPDAIQTLNRKIRERSGSMQDLSSFPEYLTGQEVSRRIYAAMQDFLPADRPDVYAPDHLLTQEAWESVRANCHAPISEKDVTLRYAVTVKRSDIRLLPLAEGWYSSPNDIHYDLLQGTAVDPAQAVLVLRDSLDGNFQFVLTCDYAGWIDTSRLAFTDRATWLNYLCPDDFAVVTDHKKNISANGCPAVYQMGAVIPCRAQPDGTARLILPLKDRDGRLISYETPAVFDETLHHGYLPYSRQQTIHQAFRFLGDVYGWGGQDESVDCSSFVQNVYKSMGIFLPRDADQQERAMPVKHDPEGMTTEERYAMVRASEPGDLLFKPGHVMMYLGTDDGGIPRVIHAASSYFDYRIDRKKHYIRRVIVSDLTYQNGEGISSIDGLSCIGSLP